MFKTPSSQDKFLISAYLLGNKVLSDSECNFVSILQSNSRFFFFFFSFILGRGVMIFNVFKSAEGQLQAV